MRILIALAVLAAPLRAFAFEGVLHMMTTVAGSTPIKTDVIIRSNGDTRTDTTVPFVDTKVSIIKRAGGGPVIEMLPGSMQYTESTLLASTSARSVTAAVSGARIVQLGPESVAGFVCQHAQVIPANGQPMEVWVTDLIPGGNNAMMDNGDALMQLLTQNGLGGFPLKLKMSQQGVALTVEATKVEVRHVDPTLFQVPSGYTKIAQADAGIHELSPQDQKMITDFEKQMQAATKD